MKDASKFARLGVRFEDSPNGGFMIHHNSESCLMVEVKSKNHLDEILMEFKELNLGKLNDSFSFLRWSLEVSRKVMCSQCRWFEEWDF